MKVTETEFLKSYLEANSHIIAKICRAYSNSNEEFNDLTQEVALQLWKSRDRFGGQSKLSTWVYRVSLNVCMSAIRKKQLKTVTIEDANRVREPEQGQDEIDLLYRALKKLPDNDKAIILLYLEEKKYQEIGEILGLSATHVGVKISRIKKRLKVLIEQEEKRA